MKLLEEQGVPFDRVNYFVDPLDADTLRGILAKAGLAPRDLLRTREPACRELGLDPETDSDDRIIDAIVAHPELLQRPIVVRGARAVLAPPVERVRELF